MNKKIAVAMSVYKSDKPEFLKQAIDSIYAQRIQDIDVFLQVDGNISESLRSVVSSYEARSDYLPEFYPKNRGLAFQLNRAINRILECNEYDYIARMDSDDICLDDRFEKQVLFFENNPDVSVLGTGILEFYNDGSTYLKKMPSKHSDLAKNIIKRCPLNHPTVMFNLKNISPEDLRYDDKLMNTQDYYLWVDLLKKQYVFSNLEDAFLKFRIDESFHSRRGLKKAMNDFKSRIYAMNELGVYTLSNCLHTFLLFFLRVSPSFIKKIAYSKLR